MERMADVVAGSHPQRPRHMPSESARDRAGVLRQPVADANAHLGRGGTALVIDESGFAKKGEPSAGVVRQWNGRLGKTDNSRVGVPQGDFLRGVPQMVALMFLAKERLAGRDTHRLLSCAGYRRDVETQASFQNSVR